MSYRKPFLQGQQYHIYNRGYENQTLFFTDKDYQKMLQFMHQQKAKFKGFRILAYSILPNHFHLIVQISKTNLEVSNFIAKWCAGYGSYFVRTHNHKSGTRLFDKKFRATRIDSYQYREKALYFVENNTLKHRLVSNIGDRKYKSNYLSEEDNKLFSFQDKKQDRDFFQDREFSK